MSGQPQASAPLSATSILDALPQLVWSADGDGHGDYFHPRLLDYIGAPLAHVKGDRWLQSVHGDDRDQVRETWFAAVRDRNGARFEFRLRRYDNVYLWHLGTAEPVRDATGDVVRWVVSLTDIDSLKATEAEHESVLDSITDGFIAVGSDLRFTYVNREAERLVRATSEDLLGRSIGEAYPDLVGTPLYAEYERVLRDRTESEFENYYEPWQRWFRLRIFPARGGGLTVYFRDITDEKRRHAADAAAYAVVDAMFDNAPVGLALWDRDMRYVRLNEALARINGLPVEAHIGRRVSEILPGVPPETETNRLRVLATGVPMLNVEVTGTTHASTGDTRHWLSSYYPVRVGDEIVGIGAFVLDVTDLKNAQEALLETERQFRNLADSIPALCWMANPDGHIFWYNQRWYEYSGTTPQEMEGWGWAKLHDPAVLPLVMARWQESLRTGTPFEMTFPLRSASGAFRQFLTRVIPVRNRAGEIVRWFGANTDVTTARETEEALRRSELRLRRIVDSGVIGTLYFDIEGRITDSNDKFLELVGYSREDLRQGLLRWDRMTPPEWKPRDDFSVHQLMTEGVGTLFEKEYFRKDGTRVPIMIGGAMLDEKNGVAYLIDISSLKAAQEDLRRSNDDLQQFAWAASHDLQEPLRMVTAYTQLLMRRRSDLFDAEARRWLDYTVQGARRMEALLRDLREYWRVTDRPAEPPQPIDTQASLAEALAILNAAIEATGATVQHDPLPRALAHETAVTLLFQNLISNAIKYRHPDRAPRITVTSERRDGTHDFAVRDNGIGIDHAYQAQIFGIFKRLHRQQDIPGTGMGLAICKRIVERYGGVLRVESVPGEGSAFRFTLPAVPR